MAVLWNHELYSTVVIIIMITVSTTFVKLQSGPRKLKTWFLIELTVRNYICMYTHIYIYIVWALYFWERVLSGENTKIRCLQRYDCFLKFSKLGQFWNLQESLAKSIASSLNSQLATKTQKNMMVGRLHPIGLPFLRELFYILPV